MGLTLQGWVQLPDFLVYNYNWQGSNSLRVWRGLLLSMPAWVAGLPHSSYRGCGGTSSAGWAASRASVSPARASNFRCAS